MNYSGIVVDRDSGDNVRIFKNFTASELRCCFLILFRILTRVFTIRCRKIIRAFSLSFENTWFEMCRARLPKQSPLWRTWLPCTRYSTNLQNSIGSLAKFLICSWSQCLARVFQINSARFVNSCESIFIPRTLEKCLSSKKRADLPISRCKSVS